MDEDNALQFVTKENEKRKGKALLYWMTSTSTSTLFSYTATTTLGLLNLCLLYWLRYYAQVEYKLEPLKDSREHE